MCTDKNINLFNELVLSLEDALQPYNIVILFSYVICRLHVPIFIDIKAILQKVSGVRFFETQCVINIDSTSVTN